MDNQLAAFRHYVLTVVQARTTNPQHDYVSALIPAMAEAGIRDPMVLADTIILLFADAVENVDRGIASVVQSLLSNPDQFAALRGVPERTGAAIEEALRIESPAQAIARVARSDTEIHGTAIKQDSTVLLILGAANRDPAQFPAPDRFDIARPRQAYLSFGKGKHSCLGAQLAKAETEAAVAAFLAHAPNVRLVDDAPQWLARPGHRWLAHLRLAL
ncbi:cytochrome P450 [Devosia rhodophyticola]|uniref:Cytochrome P450 n=1 Tax=Devosia rhodophyticola TaxID=3026423 RepID=A0ABY7Z0W4_9HYPH|nr:cytochrome P450 [Devosia rhodophyticola]WDR07099.1 cytochrome P450 [Devosia rhodophyticola]